MKVETKKPRASKSVEARRRYWVGASPAPDGTLIGRVALTFGEATKLAAALCVVERKAIDVVAADGEFLARFAQGRSGVAILTRVGDVWIG